MLLEWGLPIVVGLGIAAAVIVHKNTRQPPRCDSFDVQRVTSDIVRDRLAWSLDELPERIRDPRETDHDREARVRTCAAHVETPHGDEPLTYQVLWSDAYDGIFTVRTHPPPLPGCASSQVRSLILDEVRARETAAGHDPEAVRLRSPGELSRDLDQHERSCAGSIRLAVGERPLAWRVRGTADGRFHVEWTLQGTPDAEPRTPSDAPGTPSTDPGTPGTDP
ncbi:MAG: hypothetical protein EA398_11070 [Deltaproteobacteria bacterium]|nr:MAG: hypothetical protein EA398_11070 [Deltaproteobacteria bacterium]